MIMLAKGNRTNKLQMLVKPTVVLLRIYCGPAAILAQDNILKVEIVDFEELGMEVLRKITIKDFLLLLLR
jgi:fumarate hydratase class I